MIDPIPTACPRCAALMTRTVSGRYDVCQVCPRVRGIHTYVPVDDAPPHWMDGTRVGRSSSVAVTATKSPVSEGVTTMQPLEGGVITTTPSGARRRARRRA